MKRLTLLMLLCLGTGPRDAHAIADDRFGLYRADAKRHIAYAFIGTTAAAEFLRQRGYPEWKAVLMASFLTGVAAVVKEFGHDQFASGSDLKAGGIGTALGAGVHYSIRF